MMRREHDSLGDLDVPADAYRGVHTGRALTNFPISGRAISIYPHFIQAFACVKQAATRANAEIGVLDPLIADAIDRACEEIKDGAHLDHFVVDVMQGGAGTSTNMNVNEVVANRALELMGHRRGDYARLHPIDDVNRSQSTNDTYPTAVKLALIFALEDLFVQHTELAAAFAVKGREFADILKIGRIRLQDAVPMTLGQEFTAFAVTLAEDSARLRETIPFLSEINLGATAIGTGINADKAYAAAVVRQLSAIVGRPLTSSSNLIEATSDTGVFMLVSGMLKRAATKLSKIASDLRLLSSGPQSGFNEIFLPARQAGSSIMPGKVNPVIPEVVNQVAFAIAGADVTITMAVDNGQLQLNAFEPVIAHSLLQNIAWLTNDCHTLNVNCVAGIRANAERLELQFNTSASIATALAPRIGYARAADIALAAARDSIDVRRVVLAAGLLTVRELDELLNRRRLVGND
jgi:aspartate ammonia-lyase